MMMNFRGSNNNNNNSNNSSNRNKRRSILFDVDNNNNNNNHQYQNQNQNQNHHHRQQQQQQQLLLFNIEEEKLQQQQQHEDGGGGLRMMQQQFLFNNEEAEQQQQQQQQQQHKGRTTTSRMTTMMGNSTATTATTTRQEKEGNKNDKNDDDNNNNVENLLANAMTEMSFIDRTEGLHDLHGVSDLEEFELDVQEEKNLLKFKIIELDQVLAYNSIMMMSDTTTTGSSTGSSSNDNNNHQQNQNQQESSSSSSSSSLLLDAYEKAVEISPTYVNKMKIMILRSEKYDIEKSALRLMRFFQLKLQLFGYTKLCLDITLNDLDPSSDIEFLYTGGMQLLNQRDRAGRAIIFIFRNDPKYSTDSVMKVFYYLIMSALQDEETQLRGMIMVGYDDYVEDDNINKGVNRSSAYAASIKALPMRLVAMHVCTNNWKMKYITYLFAKLLEKWNLCRFKLHTGTPMEIIYTLMTFGIPKDTIPVDIDGSINRECHLEILYALETREKGNNDDNNNNKKQQQQRQQRIAATIIPGGEEEEEAGLEGRPVVNSTIDECVHEISSKASSTTPDSSSELLMSSPNMTTTTAPPAATAAAVTTTTARSNVPGSTVLIPSPMDVLMGRGRQPQSRPGHVRMRHLLWENIDAYNNASKREKTKLTNSILIQLKESGVRFLRQQSSSKGGGGGGMYTICNDNDSKEKISHGFRHLRSIKRSRKDNDSGGSSSSSSNARRGGGSDNSVGGDSSTSSNKKKRK